MRFLGVGPEEVMFGIRLVARGRGVGLGLLGDDGSSRRRHGEEAVEMIDGNSAGLEGRDSSHLERAGSP